MSIPNFIIPDLLLLIFPSKKKVDYTCKPNDSLQLVVHFVKNFLVFSRK